MNTNGYQSGKTKIRVYSCALVIEKSVSGIAVSGGLTTAVSFGR